MLRIGYLKGHETDLTDKLEALPLGIITVAMARRKIELWPLLSEAKIHSELSQDEKITVGKILTGTIAVGAISVLGNRSYH